MYQEMRRQEAEGLWEKVTYSDWGSAVAEESSGVRLCGDYRVTVNQNLHVAQYPLPNIQDMLTALSKCSVFSKIDLKTAFHQLEMVVTRVLCIKYSIKII